MRSIFGRQAVKALVVGVLFSGMGLGTATAGVNVGVNVNLGPPPIVIPAPPEVVLMPSNGVYFVPGLNFDVFFYNGYWWSPRGDRWYRSREYGGPWRIIERRYVPRPVVRVPGNYRGHYARERHIPYGEWRERHYRHEPERRHEMMRERHEHRDRGEGREHDRGHGRGREH